MQQIRAGKHVYKPKKELFCGVARKGDLSARAEWEDFSETGGTAETIDAAVSRAAN